MKINKFFLGFVSFFISILGSSSISINEGTLDNVIYDFYSDDENILVEILNYNDGCVFTITKIDSDFIENVGNI